MSDDDDEASTTQVFGVDIPEPYEGFMASEAIVVLKGIDSDGDMSMTIRCSDGLMVWDRMGLLALALDMTKASANSESSDADDG
jgi:hypothetical protein